MTTYIQNPLRIINKFTLISLCIVLICASCSSRQTELPGIDIPLDQMNTKVELVDKIPGQAYKNKQGHALVLQNLTDEQYIFPGDYGVRIYTKQQNSWVAVENNLNYPSGDYLLPTTQEWPLGRVVDTIPFIPEMDQPVTIRIVVVGHQEKDPKELVGAFADITINP